MNNKHDNIPADELEKAAEAGDTEAMYRYWLMFCDGGAGEPYYKALGWLEKAAAAGHEDARDAYDEYRADHGDDDSKEDQGTG